MSDPKKNFICPDCHSVINDSIRPHGRYSKCPVCEKNFIEALRFIFNNSVKIQELVNNNFLPASQLLNYHDLYISSVKNSQYEKPIYQLCEKIKKHLGGA